MLLMLFVSLLLNSKVEIYANKNTINFVLNFMYQPVTIISRNSSDFEMISDVSLPKVLLNFHRDYPNLSQITLDKMSGYILMVDDFNDLHEAMKNLTSVKNWNNHQKYLTIFHNPPSEVIMRQSFRLMFRYYVYNTVIYYSNETFFTWYPYGKKSKCGTEVHLKKVDKSNPFVHKIPRVLYGCHVNVTWVPTGILLRDPFNKSFPGVLFQFFNTLARKLNIQVIYLKNNTDFLKSHMTTGNYDMLVEDMQSRNINLVFYQIINGEFCHNIDNSVRITEANIFFLLPPRTKNIRKNYVVNMYETRLLYRIFASLVISCVIWKRLVKKSWIDSFFDIFQLSVQLLINRTPSTSKPRIFFISLIVYLMYLNIAYQTRLSSVITVPTYTAKVKSKRELLLNSNVEVIRTFNNTLQTMYYIEEFRESLRRKIRVFSKNLQPLDLIEDFMENGTEAITISYFHLYHFKNPEKLELLNYDPVSVAVHLVGAKKGFPLLEPINYWIQVIKESGLLQEYIQRSMRLLKKFEYKNNIGHEPSETLKLKHLEGAFVIWFFGIVLASAIFLIERTKGSRKYYYVREITFVKRA